MLSWLRSTLEKSNQNCYFQSYSYPGRYTPKYKAQTLSNSACYCFNNFWLVFCVKADKKEDVSL